MRPNPREVEHACLVGPQLLCSNVNPWRYLGACRLCTLSASSCGLSASLARTLDMWFTPAQASLLRPLRRHDRLIFGQKSWTYPTAKASMPQALILVKRSPGACRHLLPLRYAQELERPIVAFTLTGSSHDTMHTLPANLILPCLRADGPDIS